MAQLQFKGKQFVQNHHLAVPYHELIPQKDKSLTDKISLRDNLIIHGDNLKALKALLPTYAGKIKCIYIDPPYNTGNEGWVYSDNVNSPMIQEWFKTNKPVDNEDLTRHDKWLCMMTPRLKLLRELLTEDGVLLVSINDVEHANLSMLLDEIFGDHNFIATFIWVNEGNIDNQSKIKTNHEFVYAYAKDKTKIKPPRIIDPNIDTSSKLFNEEIQNTITKNGPKNPPSYVVLPKGFPADFEEGIIRQRTDQFPKILNDVEVKNYQIIKDVELESGWSSKNQLLLYIRNNFLPIEDIEGKETIFRLTKSGAIYTYKKRSESQDHVLSVLRNLGTTQQASRILEKMGLKFDYPKPVGLIRYIISIFTPDKEGIVLDSFSGSGTTAQAVLDQNKDDKGSRKFILVEMMDYSNKLTAERVRKVIREQNLEATFSYFELGKPIETESILSGKGLPSFIDLARYIFYTATGEEFDEGKVNEKKNFVGENKNYEVYLFYKPDLEYLKNTALTLERAKTLGKSNGKRRLVFAPAKYLDQDHLDELRIDFAQLPFEIYKSAK